MGSYSAPTAAVTGSERIATAGHATLRIATYPHQHPMRMGRQELAMGHGPPNQAHRHQVFPSVKTPLKSSMQISLLMISLPNTLLGAAKNCCEV